MVIVDTTVWIDYLGGTTNPHTSWLNRELTRQRLGLTDLILCEVLQGIRDDRVFTEVQHELPRFQGFMTGGVDLAVASTRNYRSLRKRGITVRKTMDCLIATFCLDGGHSLLHRGQDYDPFRHIPAGRSFIHDIQSADQACFQQEAREQFASCLGRRSSSITTSSQKPLSGWPAIRN